MQRILLTLLLAFMALGAPGCRSRVAGYSRDWYAGGAFSAIPGVGLSVEAGKVIRRTEQSDWALEGHVIRHFLDDKDLADDERADHGRATGARLGLKHTMSPGGKRHLTFRYGFQFHRATGEPGIVDRVGDFYGAYGSVGFETDLSRHWTMGPEFNLAVLEGAGSVEILPTFFWHLLYNF